MGFVLVKMKNVLVTGGVGFIGSHVAEYYAGKGDKVTVFDNLSRAKTSEFNWNYLKRYDNIKLVKGDVRDYKEVESAVRGVDVIIHAAAQVAVTTSMEDPRTDFEINAVGTFNVLEAARKADTDPAVVYCSTNKVYGANVNNIPIKETEGRYTFADQGFMDGISENFSIDLCEHTPYGCSKLAGDLYVQDYGECYGLDTAVFRMSCIYGTRQFGNEDQGWVAHFVISTLKGEPITVYGDGKQVRDVLFVTDLVKAYDKFIQDSGRLSGSVFNMGGGPENTLSLSELLDILEIQTGKKSEVSFDDWRPSDQRVYISNISRVRERLGWKPEVGVQEGIERLVNWFNDNKGGV